LRIDLHTAQPGCVRNRQHLSALPSPTELLGVKLANLRARTVTPRWRNQALAWFLSRLQLAQAEGQGIQTIRSTMKAAGCPPPVFDATEVSVSCVLRAHPRSGAMLRQGRGRAKRAVVGRKKKSSGRKR